MKKCILSANCQGELFKYLLLKQPQFAKNWEVDYYVNFHKTPIPEGTIENCDLFLYQALSDEWDFLSEKQLLSRVTGNTKALSLPNMVSFHFWPTAKWSPNPSELWFDSYIDTLINKGLNFSEIIHIAMKTDFSKIFDLPLMMKKSLKVEYDKNYFGRNEIFKFIDHNWREEQLFTTPNHPANALMYFVLNLILSEIGLDPIPLNTSLIYCDNEFFLPVHPFFIKHYNLKFLSENHEFPVFGENLTYKEYLMAYTDARQKNLPLLQYLVDLKK